MAYTKYSLTPANNNAAPPDGAPEGMLPSGVNDTMRDMMAQIRDCGDGIRGGTYTMTAPVITGGSITGVALSGNTLTSPVITGGTLSGGTITGAVLTGNTFTNPVITGGSVSTSTFTGNTFTSPVISGGSINNASVGATTPSTGAFTALSASGNFTVNGNTTIGDALGDTLTINARTVSTPNGLNFGGGGMYFDGSYLGLGTTSPGARLDVLNTGSPETANFSGTTGIACRVLFSSTSILHTGSGLIGYTTGSGGAVTQATSRTTGVTLNEQSGAITLVSAAGSTSWQTFTVTNSRVEATSVVNVCQKSGTDKYMIHVTAVAAGSFAVTFATTGGTTTEQPVFNFIVFAGATS